jgi:hypothetical protein
MRQTTVTKHELLNYGAETSGTHLVSSFWFLDLAAADGSPSAKSTKVMPHD